MKFLTVGDKLDIYKGGHPVAWDALQVVFVSKNYIVAENSVIAPYVLHRADFDKKILRVKKLDV
jgi:hypothetical protein